MSSKQIRFAICAFFLALAGIIAVARLNGLGYGRASVVVTESWDVRMHWSVSGVDALTPLDIELVAPVGYDIVRPSIHASGRTRLERDAAGVVRAAAELENMGQNDVVELVFRVAETPPQDTASLVDAGIRTTHGASGTLRLPLKTGRISNSLMQTTDQTTSSPVLGIRIRSGARDVTRGITLNGTISHTDYAGILAHRADEPLPFLNAYRWWVELNRAGIPFDLIKILLMLPVGALIVVVARNVVGLETYGTFLPALIAASSLQSGLPATLISFLVVVATIGGLYPVLRRLGLLHAPRMALLLTGVILLLIASAGLGIQFGAGPSLAGPMLPVVLVALTAERFARQWEDERPVDALRVMSMTIGVIVVCHLVMDWTLLGLLLLAFPELLLTLIPAHVLLGRFVGKRLTEYGRFRTLIDRRLPARTAGVLGINRRNTDLIEFANAPQHRILADDKLAAKEVLINAGVPVTPTLHVFSEVGQLADGLAELRAYSSFVVKPARGRAGGGILVLERHGSGWTTPSGRFLTESDLLHHAADLLGGTSSLGAWDRVLIERLVRPDPFNRTLSPFGLPDIRLIVHHDHTVQTMMRIPTVKSDGRANLHQGALGVAIDPLTGVLGLAHDGRRFTRYHPDTGERIAGRQIENWNHVLDIALKSARALPLGYLGVDIVIDAHLGPLVMEVNVRPGLMIQVVTRRGLRPLLRPISLEELQHRDVRSAGDAKGASRRGKSPEGRSAVANHRRSRRRSRKLLRSLWSVFLPLLLYVLIPLQASAQIETDLTATFGMDRYGNIFHSPDSLSIESGMLDRSTLIRNDDIGIVEIDALIGTSQAAAELFLRSKAQWERFAKYDQLNSHDIRGIAGVKLELGQFDVAAEITGRDRSYVGANVLGDELNVSFSFTEIEADVRSEVPVAKDHSVLLRYEGTRRMYRGSPRDPLDFDAHRVETTIGFDFDESFLSKLDLDFGWRARSYSVRRAFDARGAREDFYPLQRLTWLSVSLDAEWTLGRQISAGTRVEKEIRTDAFQDYFSYVRHAGDIEIEWHLHRRITLETSIGGRAVQYRVRTNASESDESGRPLSYRYLDVEGIMEVELSRRVELQFRIEKKERFTNVTDPAQSVRRPWSAVILGSSIEIDL